MKELIRHSVSRAFLRGGALRAEDEKKALELDALLPEIARVAKARSRDAFTLVDACSGKAVVGLLASALVLRHREGPWRTIAIERDLPRRDVAIEAAAVLGLTDQFSFATGSVEDATLWPDDPDVVVALHACARATDLIIDTATAIRARRLLVVPCCYGAGPKHDGAAEDVMAQPIADAWRARLPLPRHGLVGKRFAQSIIDAERTLRLESRGWQTEVVELFSPSVSPYNFLWRAKRVSEPTRMREAKEKHEALLSGALHFV